MKDLNKEYEDVLERKATIDNSIKKMEEYKVISKYLKLCKEQQELYSEVNDLYKKILFERYANCKHVLVLSAVEDDYTEGRSYSYYGCVKCGFDSAVANRGWGMNKEEKTMLEIMEKHQIYRVYGTYTDVACKLSIGKELWNEIKDKNPGLSEEEIISIFKERAKAKQLTLRR